jgi:hypothetical protein
VRCIFADSQGRISTITFFLQRTPDRYCLSFVFPTSLDKLTIRSIHLYAAT